MPLLSNCFMPPFFSGQIFFLKVSWLAVRDKFKSHTFLSLKSKKKREVFFLHE